MITSNIFGRSLGVEYRVHRHPEMLFGRSICLLLVVFSGNPAAWYLPTIIAAMLPLVLLLFFCFIQGIKFSARDFAILSIFATVFLVHLFSFGTITIPASGAFFLKLLTALLAMRLIPDFHRQFAVVMATLAAISLLFTLPTLVGIDMASLVRPIAIPFKQNGIQPILSIGVHSYRIEVIGGSRNCGMFWEPGAFAGYLVLSMLFLIHEPWKYARGKLLLLSLALISTQSTTGFIAFSLVLAAKLWTVGKEVRRPTRAALRGILVLLLPVSFALIYTQLPFLGQKILEQNSIVASQEGDWQLTRVGNAISDFGDVLRHPFLGWSLSNKTRHNLDDDIIARQGNGFTSAMVHLGIPITMLYLFLTFTLFRRIYASYILALVALLSIIVLLNGEQFLQYPLFMTMMFLPSSQAISVLPVMRSATAIKPRNYALGIKP